MKITSLLVSAAMLGSLVATPVFAAERPTTNSSGQSQVKREIAACQKRVLEKYLRDDKIAWEMFETTKRTAMETYQAAMAKAKKTKSKEGRVNARQVLESARVTARDTWQKVHKGAHNTWKTERAACKSAPVQQ